MTESARLDYIWLTESSKLDYFTESFCLSIFELAFFLLDISGGGGGGGGGEYLHGSNPTSACQHLPSHVLSALVLGQVEGVPVGGEY